MAQKVANLNTGDASTGGGQFDSKQWAIREKKIMDMIDSQGNDIAIDCARMETQISDLQNLVQSLQIGGPAFDLQSFE